MNLLQYNPSPEVSAAVERVAGLDRIKVLFVCLGNICRSPAAEGVMKATVAENPGGVEWVIDSAGTGNYHIGDLPDRRMRVHAQTRGLSLTHRCRQLCRADFSSYDLIFGMDRNNVENMRRVAPLEDIGKIFPMGAFLTPGTVPDYIPDPYYGGAADFEMVLDLLEDACRNLRDTVEAGRRSGNSMA